MKKPILRLTVIALVAMTTSACLHGGGAPGVEPDSPKRLDYAIAIHGGARAVSPNASEEFQETYREALAEALAVGRDLLEGGASALDAVEATVAHMEDNPLFNAGRGGVFSNVGLVELDASIMDGATLDAGAVASALTPKNPIKAARKVMTDTRHVMLSGIGADEFIGNSGLEQVAQDYFHTERRRNAWQRALEREQSSLTTDQPDVDWGTVGAVALDRQGNLAAATSTGGLTNKMHGRIGDSPIIGAGTYANNATCAVSCTGQGELFIRNAVAHRISARMEYTNDSLQDAMTDVFTRTLPEGSGGAIAVDRYGTIVMDFNTPGMSRGAADSTGRFGVFLWGDGEE
ncbi:MAG: isoaspartyl peptidase/L-asparaginase [Candidatus Sumerlaeia bacterium]|nr:isoaspartyl peptidase/L-asparaginase [Candidatus Sumerlaeia bacterium]